MVLNDRSVAGNRASLGYSVFTPGCVTALVAHETEEVAYVVSGSGELRLEGESVPFAAGQGLFVPAGVWHAVANTGEQDVVIKALGGSLKLYTAETASVTVTPPAWRPGRSR